MRVITKMLKVDTINLVYAISFLDLFAIGLNFPLFNSYLRNLGASHTTVGIVGSTYAGVQVISGPIIGGWSDVRDRKSVLKTTLLLCALCYGLLATTRSLFFIFILRFILGLIKHTQSICKAVITDLVPQKDQSAIFGKSVALASLGFVVGPFLGGNLAEHKHGYIYVCILTSILFIVNYGLASLLQEEPKKKITNNTSVWQNAKNESIKTFRELKEIDWQEYWDVFLLKFLNGLTMTTYFSNQSIYLQEKYKLSQKYMGYTISYFSTIGMVSSYFQNRINNFYNSHQSHYQRIFHAFIILTVCFICIHLSPNTWVLLFLLIPLSIASSTQRIVTMELMFEKTEKLHCGSLSGASNSIMSVARFFTPLLSGVFSDIVGEESVMLIAVIPASIGLIISFYILNNLPISKQKS